MWHMPSNISYTGHNLVPNNSLFIQNRKHTQASSSLIQSTHAPSEWIFILFLTLFS